MSQTGFEAFARNMQSLHEGIPAIFWSPLVSASERDSFEAGLRKEGIEDFAIKEWSVVGDDRLELAGSQDEYFPVAYSVPVREEFPLGLDLFSDEGMRHVIVIAKWN